MDLKKIRWKGFDWIHLAQDKDWRRFSVNAVIKFRVPQKARKFLSS
jgi:hypothetical protein